MGWWRARGGLGVVKAASWTRCRAEQRVINRSGWALLVLTGVFYTHGAGWGWGGGHNLWSPVKSQHWCLEIDVTLMPFSAVICLLALILMHVDAGLKSLAGPDRDTEGTAAGKKEKSGRRRR